MRTKLASVDNLCFLFSKFGKSHFNVSTPNSAAYNYFKRNTPKNKFIEFDSGSHLDTFMNDREQLAKTDLLPQIISRGINQLFLVNRSRTTLENSLQKAGVKIVSTSWKNQMLYEDKIKFQRFLSSNNITSPRGMIFRSLGDIKSYSNYPAVLQIPWTEGALATYIVKSRSEVLSLIKKHKLSFPLLCREFLKGPAYGICVLIGPKKLLFSSLRLQCSLTNKVNKDKPFGFYYGIQWTPSKSLTIESRRKIEELFTHVSTLMQRKGFRGVANFDFILHEGQPYLIECNPRISGASWQLSMENSLIHGEDYLKEYVKCCSGLELTSHKPFLPNSSYSGTFLDFDYLLKNLPKKAIKQTDIPVGFYKTTSNKLSLTSLSSKVPPHNDWVFLYPAQRQSSSFGAHPSLGFALLPKPVFKQSRNLLQFTQFGKKLLKLLEPAFL